MKKAGQTFLFLVLTVGFCELISRYAFYFYPGEIHQRYLIKKDHEGKIRKKVNGRGAVGRAYRGQPFKIAIFGNSTIEADYLLFSERLSSQLEMALGEGLVHVDNFAIDGHWLDGLLDSMASIRRRGLYYDIILMGYFSEGWPPPLRNQYRNHFSLGWSFGENPSHFWYFLKKFEKRRRPSEKYSNLSKKNNREKVDQNKKNEKFIDQIRQGENVYDQSFHHSSYVQERMIYEKPPKEHLASEQIEKNISEIADIGRKIAKKVYFLELGYFWHSKMLPGYDEFYMCVLPVRNFNKESPRFHSVLSLSELFEFRSRSLIIPANAHGIESLPFSQRVKELMPFEKGLIKDGVHMTSKGMAYATRSLAEKLKSLDNNKITW